MRHIYFLILVFIFCACREKKTKHVTWSDDVAPIIFKNCSPCHRTGESGGFNLLSYVDAVKKGGLLKFVTASGYMPPWPADANYSHFVGERVLSKDEIEIIANWTSNGFQRGDSVNEPHPPTFFSGSYFGKPDLIIRMNRGVQLKGNGTDAFKILKFPYQIARDTLVDFVEFVPHRRKLVHHVNGHLISYDENRNFNYLSGDCIHDETKAELMKVYQDFHIPYTDGKHPSFPTLTPNTVYYLPGYIPPSYPKSVGGFHLKKNGLFLLNNIHYGPSNVDLVDSSYINVFFRKSPIERPVIETQMGTFGISKIEPAFIIPPNTVKTFTTQTKLPYAISLLSVNPHMHLIGKTYWAFAIKPEGDTIPIIRINRWDFRWQYYYTFKHPLKLDAGTTIKVIGTYDNTSKNPNNPFYPPKTITQGNGVESMKTTEEMFQFIFTYMPYKQGDELIDLERKENVQRNQDHP